MRLRHRHRRRHCQDEEADMSIVERLRYAEKRAPNYGNEMLEAADLIEQQAERIKELEAENARLKMVPMKYRRMEFNAALQKKLDALTLALETENAAATRYAQQVAHWIEKYDALRQRIDDAPVVAWKSLDRTVFSNGFVRDTDIPLISKEDLK